MKEPDYKPHGQLVSQSSQVIALVLPGWKDVFFQNPLLPSVGLASASDYTSYSDLYRS